MRQRAFTIVELLVVMAIILVLAGLVLGTSSYVHNKGARSRAEAEIAALSAALENYKADNGAYPGATATDTLDPKAAIDSTAYQASTLALYKMISGDPSGNRQSDPTKTAYFAFKSNQLAPTDETQNVQYIKDPFGNSYGYSTKSQADVAAGNPPGGYNPTFDLWSTAGATAGNDQSKWIKNW